MLLLFKAVVQNIFCKSVQEICCFYFHLIYQHTFSSLVCGYEI
jgi:hypothetical protein